MILICQKSFPGVALMSCPVMDSASYLDTASSYWSDNYVECS